ncbi:porin [Mucilaginibacter aquatilis]|uniref:Outer membrane beta-barrel protein n=1 Tax=Mucilaginibacter aquatilis TaxID=1517760 RepID=A0A6I4IPU4_9SPHI|nr:porin [Mucilaginibacter aquatilis]MVN90623.1 outer membrane beta-barrel protein [Mucilaginibacter aquatilis]
MKKLLLAAAIFGSTATYAQDSIKKSSDLTISGYAELYYGFDFNRPVNNTRPGFVYSHNRHNEVNLNLGFIKANYDNGNIRANLALMAGTYANANLAAEQGVLKNVFEANAGLKLSKTSNLWLDAGVFASHIGFESAISKDCWVLTRNISSENTPYYETGAKLTYTTNNGKLTLTGLYLNGWQRINRVDGNSKPAGGLQVYYKPTDKVTLNYSNYLGTEGADSVRVRRFYHNFYGIFQLTRKLGLTAGFDYGTQQKAKDSNEESHIISPVVIARYQLAEKWAVAGRFEYYKDKNGAIIATGTTNGFQTKGYSLNVDYAPFSNALIRLEGKVYDSKDDIFARQNTLTNHSPLVTTSFAISF